MNDTNPPRLVPGAAEVDAMLEALLRKHLEFSLECDRAIAAVTAQKFDATSRMKSLLRPTGLQLGRAGTPKGKRGAPMVAMPIAHSRRDALAAARKYEERQTSARLAGEPTLAAKSERLAQGQRELAADCEFLLERGILVAKGRDVIRQAAQMLRDGRTREHVLRALDERISTELPQTAEEATRKELDASLEDALRREVVSSTSNPVGVKVVVGEPREVREAIDESSPAPSEPVVEKAQTPRRGRPPKAATAKTEAKPIAKVEPAVETPPPVVETKPAVVPQAPPPVATAPTAPAPRPMPSRPAPAGSRPRPGPLSRPVPTPSSTESLSARLRSTLANRNSENPST